MVNKNESIEIDIIDLGESGEGIGKLEQFTVFVHGGIPGDRVKAKIIKVKKQYAIAIVQEVLKTSPFRQAAECPYDYCGGCQTQMIDYPSQLKIKQQLVTSTLERIGGFKDIVVNDVKGMDEPRAFRNKSQYPIRKDEQLKMGFFKQRTHDVINIETCMIQHPKVNEVMAEIRTIIEANSVSIYDEKTHKGYLRHIVTRISFKTGDMMVIFVTNGKDQLLDDFAEKLTSKFDFIKSVIQNINTKKGNRVMGYENKTILGQDKIVDYIDDLSFEISPLSFLQVNPIQTEVLYKSALDMLDISKDDTVFDIYCGIGTISLFLAKHAKKVVGVELIDIAIEDAKRNAINNNLNNTEFFAGKAEVVIPKLYQSGYSADIVVVDPPRKGCEQEVLDTILDMEPKQVVYVSCKVSTMARDLKILSEKYEVIEVQPVDLFPHTTHVEVILRLTLKKSL